MQVDEPLGRESLQLVGVNEILVGMAAAEEQHGGPERRSFRPLRRALLQKAPERRQAGAGADHDDRRRGVLRQAKASLGFAHRGVDEVAGAPAAR